MSQSCLKCHIRNATRSAGWGWCWRHVVPLFSSAWSLLSVSFFLLLEHVFIKTFYGVPFSFYAPLLNREHTEQQQQQQSAISCSMSVLHTLDCLLHCVCGNILATSCGHASCAFLPSAFFSGFLFVLCICEAWSLESVSLGFYCVYVFECHNIKTPCGVHATNFCPYRNDNLVWTW